MNPQNYITKLFKLITCPDGATDSAAAGATNSVSADSTPDSLASSQAQNTEKIFTLLVADRVLFPGLYRGGKAPAFIQIKDIVNRNESFMAAFAQYFADIHWELPDTLLSFFYNWLDGIDNNELLHVPGWVHEAALTAASCSGPDNSGSGNNSRRKRQGSYYTPVFLVKHMVYSSFRYLLGNTTGFDDIKLQVLDPACGGGAFLLEAWNLLRRRGMTVENALVSVFGVDIDIDAVNLSILVLTLAALADKEGAGSAQHYREVLRNRIIAGNSLSSLYQTPTLFGSMLPDEIKWQDIFPVVFADETPHDQQGFDIVIGNPPYVANKLINDTEKNYYKQNYHSASGQFDLAVPFIEQGLHLLRPGGILCFITSNKFLAADYGKPLRESLLTGYRVFDLTDVSTLNSFANTAAYPVIATIGKTRPTNNLCPVRISIINKGEDLQENPEESGSIQVEQDFFRAHKDFLITTQLNNMIFPLIRKLTQSQARIPQNSIRCGLAVTGFNKWLSKDLPTLCGQENIYRSFIQAGDIKPFEVNPSSWIDLRYHKDKDTGRLKAPKLVIPGIAKSLMAAVDTSGSLLGRVYYVSEADTPYNLYYLAALLNSIVLNFYYRVMYWPVHLAGDYLRFNSGYLANLPLCPDSIFREPQQKERADKLAAISASIPQKVANQGAFEELQCRAEALVFALYCLDKRETEIIMDFMGLSSENRDKILMHTREV